MREVRAPATLDTILAWDAITVRNWIRRARTQELRVAPQFNWLGLAEAAAFNARRSADAVGRALDSYPQAQRALLQEALLEERTLFQPADGDGHSWLLGAIDARRWAEASIAVYDHLTAKTLSRERRGYQDSVMHLRAYLIARIGTIPGDRIFGSDDLLFYFFDGLRISAEEARVKSQTVREQLRVRERSPRLARDLQLLRAAKNRLAPLALLVTSGQLKPPTSLLPWLELRDQLL